MTQEAVMSSGAHDAPFAPPTPTEVAVGIAHIEAELALVAPMPTATSAPEDIEPWVLDHSDDVWHSNGAVGASAFARRAHRAGLLNAEDEVILARRIEAAAFAQERLDSGVELLRTQRRGLEHVVREGDEARERMILANTRLVTKIARSGLGRAGGGLQFDDLQQAGFTGLMRAVQKFDHTMGLKFSTYATWWIKQSISRTIDDEARVIRVPVHALEKSRVVDTARRRAGLTWDEAIADPSRLGGDCSAEQVERTRQVLRPCLSLDQVVEEVDVVDVDETALDMVTEREAFAQTWKDFADHLTTIPGLGVRAVEILEKRFGLTSHEPMTLDQIGQHFGVTRERIRQIEKKALEALRAEAAPPVVSGP